MVNRSFIFCLLAYFCIFDVKVSKSPPKSKMSGLTKAIVPTMVSVEEATEFKEMFSKVFGYISQFGLNYETLELDMNPEKKFHKSAENTEIKIGDNALSIKYNRNFI